MEMETMRKKYLQRRRSSSSTGSSSAVSFSAKLPDDVCVEFQDSSICAVKYSTNPFSEIRESIVEMIENVGVRDWKQMEELIYCYIALNPTEVHTFIQDAFLSLLPF